MDNKAKRLVITGVSGLLGNNLARYFRDSFAVTGIYNSHPVEIEGIGLKKADIVTADLRSLMGELAPDVVLHCASLTDVDQCERDKELARAINVLGTERLVKSLSGTEAKLIFISTDSVYDGINGSFSENDAASPLNYYGLTKYEGEQLVMRREDSLVLRTNIFGINILEKNSLAEWAIAELSAGHRIKGLADVRFSTIYTFELARLIGLALKKKLEGVYNCASRDSMTKYEFCLRLASRLGLDSSLITPVKLADFPFYAKRGHDLSLDTTKVFKALGEDGPAIEHSLDIFASDNQAGLPYEIKGSSRSWYPRLEVLPYGRQCIDDDDISAVVNILKSSNLTQGKTVSGFEEALCASTGAKFCAAFNSGTSALHGACLAAGMSAGDEFITTPNTFVASANCGVYCGARPVFADIDENTYNIDPSEIENRISKDTRTVIPVHFAGQSCDMERIHGIVKSAERTHARKIYLIEDASHALGSSYKGHPCGSCAYSDMTVMSFHPVKHVTTGEGGAVLTNSEELYHRLKRFRSHGITNTAEELLSRTEAFGRDSEQNPWYYEQQDLGYNYRITDIQCALGLSQLKKLPFFIMRRRALADWYSRAFKGMHFITPPTRAAECETNWHLYVLKIDFEHAGVDRGAFMRKLKIGGILTQVHYIPVHTQPFYREKFGYKWGDYPKAEAYYRQCLSIPLFPLLTYGQAKRVVDGIREGLGLD